MLRHGWKVLAGGAPAKPPKHCGGGLTPILVATIVGGGIGFSVDEWSSALDGAAARQPSFIGRASVIDGDTIEIHGHRIRLYGVDAPESRQECRRGGQTYGCGKEAAFGLANKLGAQPVACEQMNRDHYGRIVALCRIEAEDVSGWLVRQGYAVAYRRYGGDRYDDDEASARAAKRGVWAGDFEMPWDWRTVRRR